MAYQDLVIADGAIAYWRFEEVAGTVAVATVGTNGNHVGSITVNQVGIVNKTYFWDENTTPGTQINVPSTASLNTLTTLTAECWVKRGVANSFSALEKKSPTAVNVFTLGPDT